MAILKISSSSFSSTITLASLEADVSLVEVVSLAGVSLADVSLEDVVSLESDVSLEAVGGVGLDGSASSV